MKRLSNQKLIQIKAGGISWSVVGFVSVITTFIIGVVDGFIRPLPCHQ